MEEKSQQFESRKLQYTEKVSQLEITCSDKDVRIKFLEEDLANYQALISKKDTQIMSLVELQILAKHNVLQHPAVLEYGTSDL